MATWHQSRNPAALAALYVPHPTLWRVVINPPGECAAAIEFSRKRKTDAYVRHAKKHGHGRHTVAIPPARYTARYGATHG